MIPNEMVQPHTKRHQENRKDLAQNWKRKTAGIWKRTEIFCASIFIKWRQC